MHRERRLSAWAGNARGSQIVCGDGVEGDDPNRPAIAISKH